MRQEEGENLPDHERPCIRFKYLRAQKPPRGGKRVVIAIVRKLALMIRRMLLDNVRYRVTGAMAT